MEGDMFTLPELGECADKAPDHKNPCERISRLNPQYTERPDTDIWRRWMVTFTDFKNRLVTGTGKDKEEAAANAIARIRQGVMG